MQGYVWQGIGFWLPAAVHLAPWCTLNDEILEFKGSSSDVKHAEEALLEQAQLDKLDMAPWRSWYDDKVVDFNGSSHNIAVAREHVKFGLDFLTLDGSLWIGKRPSALDEQFRIDLKYQLDLWSSRLGLKRRYILSRFNPLVWWSDDPKMVTTSYNCVDCEKLELERQACQWQNRQIPRDIQSEVAFEFVSSIDNVEDKWAKCEHLVRSKRARMAVGICDRENCQEVFIAYMGLQGSFSTETMENPRFVDLGRVLPGFKLYFSYMMGASIFNFKMYHMYHVRTMTYEDRKFQMCVQIFQNNQIGNDLAMEFANGLPVLNFVDSRGRCPLVVAVSCKNTGMVHFLLSVGADPMFPDGDNVSALLYAKAKKSESYDSLKAESGDLSISCDDLIHAMKKNSLREFDLVLEILLTEGVHLDQMEVDGSSLLNYTLSRTDWVWAISRLIERGACPTEADKKGRVPLFSAIFFLRDKELLESGILLSPSLDLQVASEAVEVAKQAGCRAAADVLRERCGLRL